MPDTEAILAILGLLSGGFAWDYWYTRRYQE